MHQAHASGWPSFVASSAESVAQRLSECRVRDHRSCFIVEEERFLDAGKPVAFDDNEIRVPLLCRRCPDLTSHVQRNAVPSCRSETATCGSPVTARPASRYPARPAFQNREEEPVSRYLGFCRRRLLLLLRAPARRSIDTASHHDELVSILRGVAMIAGGNVHAASCRVPRNVRVPLVLKLVAVRQNILPRLSCACSFLAFLYSYNSSQAVLTTKPR